MSDCIFCKIIAGEIPAYRLYEDDEFVVILDRFPSRLGHVLILPKSHADNLFSLDALSCERLMPLTQKVAKAMQDILSFDGLNLLQNNGAVAGQSVNHFHLHLIPRYQQDSITIKWQTTDPAHEAFLALRDQIAGLL